ncbi:putative EF-hand domain-containing protein 1 [Monocercomonoides exilis]|uniref:putative EF-hand domain-containing protein 1 n=1 Tax=Monocercomonoides exilis TaxID=2049356 RepID=UPI00355A71A7|nr:putative EF-hand domain-containing protein 1 [Monocercomonoides exilis]|eukprot:MONOS_4586.1-p1 / transcript=MONOS_4586.1 / gene=MONOS_4586 / organism=Monocercomonoides_exilis_PA203 / gene_product=EFHC1 / transcript_product=EFHC1 / location=Mono_scaffold00123:76987-79815(-) / protein_length=871 / sequence_SO=supercontig / SO=protein_coding / is_pseudo=false
MSYKTEKLSADDNLKAQVKLPFLPGTTFTDPKKTNFAKSHTLGYKDGIPTAKLDYPSIGNEFRRTIDERFSSEELEKSRDFTFGWTRKCLEYSSVGGPDIKSRGTTIVSATGTTAPPTAETIPSFIAYDKLVMCFYAYFKEAVHESREEVYRVRNVDILFYLEDDTISVVEHKQNNSGIVQGTFLRRHRVPRDERDPDSGCIELDDLEVGKDVRIYGRLFHIYDANGSTREYLEKEYGKILSEREPLPSDAHAKEREKIESHIRVTVRDPDTTTQKFLKYDRQVLRFNAVWNDATMFGEQRFFALHYFLSDNTIEIVELRKANSGHEAFPSFVRRQSVPRDGVAHLHHSDTAYEPMQPEDLMIGKEVTIFGRTFLLYDCDDFTRRWYQQNMGVTDPMDPLPLGAEETSTADREVPPYLGFGEELDSLATCFHIQPRPWPRDYFKLLVKDKDAFHFLCRIETASPGESERRFVLTFHLSDDTLSIYEPPQRNIGYVQGKFMERTKMYKPDSNVYYGPGDFFVGAVLEIRTRRFVLLDCDSKTMQMQSDMGCPEPDLVRIEAEYRLRLSDLYNMQRANKAFDKLGKTATLTKFKQMMDAFQVGPTQLEMQALAEVYGNSSSSGYSEGGEGEEPELDITAFREAIREAPRIMDGTLFKTDAALHVHPITPGTITVTDATGSKTRSFGPGGRMGVSMSGAGGVGVRDATLATSSVSLEPTDHSELTLTTRAFGPVGKATQPSPSLVKAVPHSSGVMTGTIKRTLLEGESEADFRKRLAKEKQIMMKAVERINLKHASLTEAFNAFTQKQTPRLSRERFRDQMIKYGVLQKTSEMELLERHFFGDAEDIGYQDFIRAMNPEETPLSFTAAIAPART